MWIKKNGDHIDKHHGRVDVLIELTPREIQYKKFLKCCIISF